MVKREFLLRLLMLPLAISGVSLAAAQGSTRTMYGLIGQIKARPGHRDELAGLLVEGTRAMPGCLCYIVANDASDADSIWITEIWTDQRSHQASLSLPAVRRAIDRGKPLIAGMGSRVELAPVGGHGLTVPE